MRIAELEGEFANRRRLTSDDFANTSRGNCEGKVKGGGKFNKGKKCVNTWMPSALHGECPSDESGHPRCFDFNLGHGCAEATAGGRCKKGVHTCMKRVPGKEHGCGGNHSSCDATCTVKPIL